MQEDKNEMIEIDMQELFGLLLAKAWLIILTAVLTGVVAFLISFYAITPMYESTTSIYILNKDTGTSMTLSDAQLASQLTQDYEHLIKGRTVLEQVMADFEIVDERYESFVERVFVSNPKGTRILTITVKDKNPVTAQKLADAIREAAAVHIQEVTDVKAVNVTEVANLPEEPSEPSVPKWTVLGALLGMILSAAIIIVIFLMDDTIKSSEDIEKYLELSTLALIPSMAIQDKRKGKNGADKKAPTVSSPQQVVAEKQLKEEFKKDGIEIIDVDEVVVENAGH